MAIAIDWARATWQDGCTAVAHMTDKLGTPIDPGIFDTVVALNLLGLRTFQSCEGHIEYKHAYPWVTLIHQEHNSRYVRGWLEVCELEEEAKREKTPEAHDRWLTADLAFRLQCAAWKHEDTLQQQLIALLNRFYADQVPLSTRLMVVRLHPGMCRLQPGFARHVEDMPDPLKLTYLERGQAEMAAFTAFLKQHIGV